MNWAVKTEAVHADRFKFPKNKDVFVRLLNQLYNEGKQAGIIEQKQRMEAEFLHRQRTVRVEALKVLTDYYRSVGQTGSVLAEAMKSEAGQL